MNNCATANAVNTVAEFDISGLEAMLAGTLCLMSAYSHCHCPSSNNKETSNENSPANNQGLIGLKIVSNLTCLQYQNSLSPEFRRVLSKVCDSWRQHSVLAQPSQDPGELASAAQASNWHAAPSTVQ